VDKVVHFEIPFENNVQAAGGKVVTPKTAIPGMGAYGRIADTEGNVIGVFEAAMG
jgi:predicted enzyme related to lactoylglutathione lyase